MTALLPAPVAQWPSRAPRISVIVCAYNEERYLKTCLHSVFAQTRVPDEVIVVNNASTDGTRAVALALPGVRLVDEPCPGLVRAREAGRRHSAGDLLVYLDADSRLPLRWIEQAERRFQANDDLVGLSGAFRYYDWDLGSRILLGAYDLLVAPVVHVIVRDLLRLGAVFYGGGFCVRREALDRIGGFDTSIEFHGEDTNLGRRLSRVGTVALSNRCSIATSARRYVALGRRAVFGLYIRNFCSEIFRRRPSDRGHVDVRV